MGFGYFGWREQHTLAELARLVRPVPDIAGVTYVPTADEMRAVAAFTAVTAALKHGGTADIAARTAPIDAATGRYWLVETEQSVAEVSAYYRQPENRPGWILDGDSGDLIILRRGTERMLIVAHEDWPRPRVVVAYIHRP